jgi:hypothetical protein
LHLKSNGGKINRFDGGGPSNYDYMYLTAGPAEKGSKIIDVQTGD